jgi:hypothetical protein
VACIIVASLSGGQHTITLDGPTSAKSRKRLHILLAVDRDAS